MAEPQQRGTWDMGLRWDAPDAQWRTLWDRAGLTDAPAGSGFVPRAPTPCPRGPGIRGHKGAGCDRPPAPRPPDTSR